MAKRTNRRKSLLKVSRESTSRRVRQLLKPYLFILPALFKGMGVIKWVAELLAAWDSIINNYMLENGDVCFV